MSSDCHVEPGNALETTPPRLSVTQETAWIMKVINSHKSTKCTQNQNQGIASQRNPSQACCHINNTCSTPAIPRPHSSPVSLQPRLELPDVGVGLLWELVPEAWDATLPVGTAPPFCSGTGALGIRVLLVVSTADSVTPQAPVTADRSWMLLSAAGVEPQLAACVIQMESVSRSKTAIGFLSIIIKYTVCTTGQKHTVR